MLLFQAEPRKQSRRPCTTIPYFWRDFMYGILIPKLLGLEELRHISLKFNKVKAFLYLVNVEYRQGTSSHRRTGELVES